MSRKNNAAVSKTISTARSVADETATLKKSVKNKGAKFGFVSRVRSGFLSWFHRGHIFAAATYLFEAFSCTLFAYTIVLALTLYVVPGVIFGIGVATGATISEDLRVLIMTWWIPSFFFLGIFAVLTVMCLRAVFAWYHGLFIRFRARRRAWLAERYGEGK